MNKVRTRFAPSPTGFMHVGGVRTAIFAWAFAKKHGGDFVLRIEDTDKSREVEGSIDHIIESLKWLSVEWQEGPDVGGKHGPYKQSQRLDIYKDWAQRLVDKDLAYADPFSPEEVQEFRVKAQSEKKPFLFRNFRPEKLNAPKDWYGRVPLRFKTVEPTRTDWHDEVRGSLSAGPEALDDFVLIKADGYPTYNFAHIIDDYLMEISHVMRGEEFISSTPKFIALHKALDLPLPKLTTMPPILGKEGGKKLSKRDGAKDVLEYREEGFLPDAMVNFLSSLGWNDGTEKEVYTPEEFVEKFTLERIQRKGAHFDDMKLNWLNWKHFELLIKSDLASTLSAVHLKPDPNLDNTLAAALAASKSRSIDEFKQQMEIFLGNPSFVLTEDNLKQVDNNLSLAVARKYLESAISTLSDCDFSSETTEKVLRADMKELNAQPRQYLNLVRWAVSGRKVSPNLFDVLSVLGKEESLKRLRESAESK